MTARGVRRAATIVAALALLAVLGAVVANSYRNDDAAAFEAARRDPADLYLDTPLGRTRYRLYGPHDGPTIVLIHGFNGYVESWAPNIDALTGSGFRVVAYDLWGRGLSSRPSADMTLEAFHEQLAALLGHLGATEVTLMGSSFGCVVAADFAQRHPDRVERLVMVGPAGWPSTSSAKWIKFPVLGDLAFGLAGQRLLRPKVEAYFHGKPAQWAMDYWDRYASYPGFTRAALSTLRHAPVTDYTDGWRRLGALDQPMLFVWGKQDVSFPYANREKVANFMPRAKIVGIDDAAHWVNIEQPDATNAVILAFLKDPPS